MPGSVVNSGDIAGNRANERPGGQKAGEPQRIRRGGHQPLADRIGSRGDVRYRSFLTSSPLEATVTLEPQPVDHELLCLTKFLLNFSLGPLKFLTQRLPQSQGMGLLLSLTGTER